MLKKQDPNKKYRNYKSKWQALDNWKKRGKEISDIIEGSVLPSVYKIRRRLKSVKADKQNK